MNSKTFKIKSNYFIINNKRIIILKQIKILLKNNIRRNRKYQNNFQKMNKL